MSHRFRSARAALRLPWLASALLAVLAALGMQVAVSTGAHAAGVERRAAPRAAQLSFPPDRGGLLYAA
jgi:hypothetical protein